MAYFPYSYVWRYRWRHCAPLQVAKRQLNKMATDKEVNSLKPTQNRSIRNWKMPARRRKHHMTSNYSRIFLQNILKKDIQEIPTAELQEFTYDFFRFNSVVFVYIIKRTLHVGSKIWILCSRGKKISHLFALLTQEICFCHSNINFISSRHRVISSFII